jgi:hypothetical protein
MGSGDSEGENKSGWGAIMFDAISQGPKKSLFQGPNPLPLALVMDVARIKSITHGAV